MDKSKIISILQDSLSTEIICVLRYRNHYYAATGLESPAVRDEFLKHSEDETKHMDQIAQRIISLGGIPDFSPATAIKRANVDYYGGKTMDDMIRANLAAEQIAIEVYTNAILEIGDSDPATTNMLETILEKEEEHSSDMERLLS